MEKITISIVLLFSCIFALNVSAAPDGTPPTIESIEVLTKEVAPGGKVKIKVTVSDDVSGMHSVSFQFKSPSGNSSFIPIVFSQINDPLKHTYIFESDRSISDYAEYGEWELYQVNTNDRASNYRYYSKYNENHHIIDNISFTVDPNAPKEEVEVDDGFKAFEPKVDIPTDKEFTITFSLNLDIKTLIDRNIYVIDSLGNKVPLMFIIDRGEKEDTSQVTIVPLNPYRASSTYTLYVKDIYSSSGTKLEQNTKMKFTTR